ncbi:MAG: exonuclease domain-containing protein, partial [Candidatus Gracilibacteria bacterium]|nr:exonuclease domain-containing protein [Candidatus Gracilibacteria bacterium]
MIVCLDLETTGVDCKKDSIIEYALVKFDENTFKEIDRLEGLINPGFPIPELITNITNIFDKDVENSPKWNNDIIFKITEFIGDCPIIGHNTPFDRDFLINNGVDIQENIILDTFVLANIILLDEKSLNLGSLLDSYGIELSGAHRAINDVLGTIKLFEKLTSDFKKLPNENKVLLNYIFSNSNDKSFGFYKDLFEFDKIIITQEEFIKIILKKIKKYKKIQRITNEEKIKLSIEDIFKNLPNFEIRENQLNMANLVDDSFKNNKKILIEAPTGVGKTFGYLLPSIINSLNNDIQVIISTNTKALQDQIFFKDLEYLRKNLGYDFYYSKLKGRKNYIGVTRFLDNLFYQEVLDLDETMFYSKITNWLLITKYGELDELNFNPKEFNLLKNINADNFITLSDVNDNKYYEFLFKARTQAQNSNIVIINHSLLLQDINSLNPIFGQIQNLIVDESHNLEDSATDALKKSFQINSLFEANSKIKSILNKQNIILDNIDNYEKNLTDNITLLFDLLSDYSLKKNTYSNDYFEILIEDDFFEENNDIINLIDNIEIAFSSYFNLFSNIEDEVNSKIKGDLGIIEEVEFIVKKIFLREDKKIIPIFTYNKNYNHQISFTLLNPGEFLEENLWEKLDNLVLTSATLEVGESFDYIKNILSLNEGFYFHKLQTDFDYSKQALVFVPNDLGTIKYNNPKINDFLLNFFKIVGGKSLALFTSFASIRDLYLYLNIPLKKENINILAQGVAGSKHKIANHFKNHSNNSIILGTDSFWEGVDIPGDDLKYLIIHKFPFM